MLFDGKFLSSLRLYRKLRMNESRARSINSETALINYINHHYTTGHLFYGPCYERSLPSRVEKLSGIVH